MVGFEKPLRAVKVIKDQIQYRSQSLLNLARGYFTKSYGWVRLRDVAKNFPSQVITITIMICNDVALTVLLDLTRGSGDAPPGKF